MKVVITPRAEADIANQLAWGQQQFGTGVVERTFARLSHFLEDTLPNHPGTLGRAVTDKGIHEVHIPRAPFVVFYRIEPDLIRILALFHAAQDRSTFESD